MPDCLFCLIANGKTDTIILHEDETFVVFRDINPKAPFHILIVPKEHIDSAGALNAEHGPMLGRIFEVAAQLVKENGYESGYRVVSNVGSEGGQSVPHLHFHVLAGRQMQWPPG